MNASYMSGTRLSDLHILCHLLFYLLALRVGIIPILQGKIEAS